MRSKEQVISRELTVDKQKNKVVVFVSLRPRMGREPTVHVGVNDVRQWLVDQGVDAGVLVAGAAVHNNMSRNLGLRTLEDLKTTMVFQLGAEAPAEAPAEEPAEEVAPAPEPEVVEAALVSVGFEAAPAAEEPVKAEVKKKPRARKPRAKKSVNK
jgi:hypothetical protein